MLALWTFGLASAAGVSAAPVHWDYVPLRTEAQRAAGEVGGEMGQMAFTLTVCPQNPEYLAMGIDTAAAYVSEDGGHHWELRRRGIYSNGVQSIAFDPVNDQVLWAAGSRSSGGGVSLPLDPKLYDPKVDGIYRSTDLGRSWTLLRNAAFARNHAQNEYFAFDPDSAGPDGCQTVFVATHDAGLLKTTDGGATWAEVGPVRAIFSAVVRHHASGWIWLAANEGLWLSIDDGSTWQEAQPPALPVTGFAVHPTDPRSAYVALSTGGVWRTDDAGETWQQCAGLPRERWVRLAISPADPKTLYVDATRWGGPVPYHTHDGGTRWQPMESRQAGFYGTGIYWAEGLATHPTDPRVAYHLHPLRRTGDGGKTWQLIGNGVSGSRRGTRTSIAFRPDRPRKMVFFHIDHGAALTLDDGDTWSYVTAPRQADIGAMTMPGGACDPTPGSRRLISAVGGWYKQRLCLSEDDGENWTVFPDMEDNYRFFAWHVQDPRVVYLGTAKGGLRSDDGGATWQPLDRPIRAMSSANGDIIHAVTVVDRGRCRVERSTDKGVSWETLGGEVPHHIYDIDVDPRDPGRVYAATGYGGVWVYDGQSWSARGERDGLEQDVFGSLVFQCVAVDPVNPDIVYAGQNHCWRGAARGVFRSTDRGATWENINGNLGPDLTVWSITVSPHGGTVWLGTDYGNWRMSENARRGIEE